MQGCTFKEDPVYSYMIGLSCCYSGISMDCALFWMYSKIQKSSRVIHFGLVSSDMKKMIPSDMKNTCSCVL